MGGTTAGGAGCEIAAVAGGGVMVSSSIETTSGVGSEYTTSCIGGSAISGRSSVLAGASNISATMGTGGCSIFATWRTLRKPSTKST